MCSKPCFGTCCGVLILITIVCAAAIPWYFFGSETQAVDDCKIMTLIGWKRAYCRSDDCIVDPCVLGSEYDWRTGGSMSNIAKVFDTAGGLLVVSGIFGLITSVALFYRHCSNSPQAKQRSGWHIASSILASIFILVSIAYFAGQIPKAYVDDNLCTSDQSGTPCASFMGSTDNDNNGYDVKTYWGGMGWFAGLALLVFNLIAICLSATSFESPVEYTVITQYQGAPQYGANPQLHEGGYQASTYLLDANKK